MSGMKGKVVVIAAQVGDLPRRVCDHAVLATSPPHGLSDVTARKAAETALSAARHEAERANRTKDVFLAMLGHELRNLLAPILTALQLMRLRSGETREIGVLERQAKHLGRMVDDLLDVARITRRDRPSEGTD